MPWHPQSASRSLSKDFEAKLKALVDHLLALPSVQRNVLKLEMVVCAIISISSILGSQGFQRQKVFDSGKELGFHSGGPVHTVGIFPVPHILSPEQYTQKIHPMLDKFTALPSTQKTYQKYDLVGRLSINYSTLERAQ
ncbi:hypothetical protein B0H13DRAFT_1922927 [Mycena leptocephala]|nr:hypothetical protein B0H13DRAFT_1922927 [Mycena leptocephala]